MKKIITALLVIACLFTAVSCKDEVKPWDKLMGYKVFDPTKLETDGEKAFAEAFDLFCSLDFSDYFKMTSEETVFTIEDSDNEIYGTLTITFDPEDETTPFTCIFEGSYNDLPVERRYTSENLYDGITPVSGTPDALDTLIYDITNCPSNNDEIINSSLNTTYELYSLRDLVYLSDAVITLKSKTPEEHNSKESFKTGMNLHNELKYFSFNESYSDEIKFDITYAEGKRTLTAKLYETYSDPVCYSILELEGDTYLITHPSN